MSRVGVSEVKPRYDGTWPPTYGGHHPCERCGLPVKHLPVHPSFYYSMEPHDCTILCGKPTTKGVACVAHKVDGQPCSTHGGPRNPRWVKRDRRRAELDELKRIQNIGKRMDCIVKLRDAFDAIAEFR